MNTIGDGIEYGVTTDPKRDKKQKLIEEQEERHFFQLV